MIFLGVCHDPFQKYVDLSMYLRHSVCLWDLSHILLVIRYFTDAELLLRPDRPRIHKWDVTLAFRVIGSFSDDETRHTFAQVQKVILVLLLQVPHWLTFRWWVCCCLYFWHKPAKLAQSFFVLYFCPCLSLRPFQLYFIPWILLTSLRVLTLFFRSYFCLTGPFNYISSWKSQSSSSSFIL